MCVLHYNFVFLLLSIKIFLKGKKKELKNKGNRRRGNGDTQFFTKRKRFHVDFRPRKGLSSPLKT